MSDQLDRFQDLLLREAVPAGMVSARDAARLGDRHLLDSLRPVPLIGAADASAYDLGSGAGLPGIPIALACPHLRMTLVEVRRHRAEFLRLAVEELELGNAHVYARRAETLRERVPLCLARAFSPIRAAWQIADRLLLPRGRLVYWAGRSFDPGVDPPTSADHTEVFATGEFARSGPLVIMTRQ